MTTTSPLPKTVPLTSRNSDLYIATKAPKGGTHQDAGAKSVRFRAINGEHALQKASDKNLVLEGRHLSTHKPEHVGWHVRETSETAVEKCYKLYYFDQLIDTSKGVGSKERFEFIANWLAAKGATPNRLCVADAPNADAAIKKYAP